MDRLIWAYALSPEANRPADFGELNAADVERYVRVATERATRVRKCWTAAVAGPLEASTPDHRPKFTNKMGRAAARRLTDDDAVQWLATKPDALAEVRHLVKWIGEASDKALPLLPKRNQRRRLADHFWCDVLGALVGMLEEIEEAVDKLRDRAIDWLAAEAWRRYQCSRDGDWGATPNGRNRSRPCRGARDRDEGLTDELLQSMVRSLLQSLCDGLWAKQVTLDMLILKLRLLAIWLCPDILAHRLVWDHCWAPLADNWVEQHMLDLMDGVFPISFDSRGQDR